MIIIKSPDDKFVAPKKPPVIVLLATGIIVLPAFTSDVRVVYEFMMYGVVVTVKLPCFPRWLKRDDERRRKVAKTKMVLF
jgi:hypothetical protein